MANLISWAGVKNVASAVGHGLNPFDNGAGFTAHPAPTPLYKAQQSIKAANQRLAATPPKFGPLTNPVTLQNFMTANQQAANVKFNPVTAGIKVAAPAAVDIGRQFVTRPLAEIANTIQHPFTQNTYTPSGAIPKFIFGQKPVQNFNKLAGNTAATHPGGGAIPLAVGDVLLHLLQDLPVAHQVLGGSETLGKELPAIFKHFSNTSTAVGAAKGGDKLSIPKALPASTTPAILRGRPTNLTEAAYQRSKGVKIPLGKKPAVPAQIALKGGNKPEQDVPAFMRNDSAKSAKDLLARNAYQKALEEFDKSSLGMPKEPTTIPVTKVDSLGRTIKVTPGTKVPVGPKGVKVKAPKLTGPEATFGGVAGKAKPFASKVTALRQIGTDSAHAIADRIQGTDHMYQTLRANARNAVPTALKLKGNDVEDFWNTVKNGATPTNDNVAQAAKEWKAFSPQFRERGVGAGLKIGDQPNYLPKEYNPNVFKAGTAENATAADALVKAGQAKDINEAQSILRGYQGQSLGTSTFGHFEKARSKIDIPGELHSTGVLDKYIDQGSRRIAEAHHFGPNGEIGKTLVGNVSKEGGDAHKAGEALQNYLHNPSAGKADPFGKAARGTFALLRETKAGLSHSVQSTNVAVDTRLRDFGSGWKDFITRNKDAAQFIKEADTTNMNDIRGIATQETGLQGKAGKFIAPGLHHIMQMNRAIATVAGKNYGDWLAVRGDAKSIARLRELGVKGDIGSKLTRPQQLDASRGVVNETMFSSSRATTPINAETKTGKIVGQARTGYLYKQTGFIWNRVMKEAARGNLAPLAKLGTLGLPGAAGVAAVKNRISGKSEGLGGLALNSAGAVGGLPAELGVSAARYGLSSKEKAIETIAGDTAPIAGDATKLISSAYDAAKGNTKPIESYAAGLVPIAGSRLAKVANPPPNIAPKGSPGDLKAKGTAEAKALESKAGQADTLQKLSNGKYAYTTSDGDVTVHQVDSLQAARKALAESAFKKSGDSYRTVGNTVYRKDAAGNVTTMTKDAYAYKIGAATLIGQKNANDMGGWMKTAKGQLDSIAKQLQDPNIDPLDAQQLQNDADSLQSQIDKYTKYGGFTKGGSSNSSSTTGFASASKGKISPPKGISVKKLAAPSFKVTGGKKYSISKLPSNYLTKKLA